MVEVVLIGWYELQLWLIFFLCWALFGIIIISINQSNNRQLEHRICRCKRCTNSTPCANQHLVCKCHHLRDEQFWTIHV